MSEAIRILLVDDQLLFLESLKMVIENLAPDITVVGTRQNGEEAIRSLEQQIPDIILMDVRMPVMDGVTATRIIKEEYPDIRIVMLTTFEDDEYVNEALHCGASGYMLKNIAPEMLISAIRAVHNGSILISPGVALPLIDHAYKASGRSNPPPPWYAELRPKEKQILKLVLQGYGNKEIAARVHLGHQTVRNYISTIYAKLEVKDRRGAMEKARTFML